MAPPDPHFLVARRPHRWRQWLTRPGEISLAQPSLASLDFLVDLHLWIDGHHIVHWVHGGRTDMHNLVLLCHRHHWMVHEYGFQLVRVDDGSILTIPPPPESYRPRAPD